jgi:hypothetical protein
MSNYKKEQDDLFKKWQNERNYDNFVYDGILREENYWSSIPKIAFVLKEGNDKFNPISPIPEDKKGYGPKGSSGTFWRYMAGYTNIITKIWNDEDVTKKDCLKAKEITNNSQAYINIKKSFENKKSSNYKDIINYAEKDSEFLQEQINIINPDVIYLGGTYDAFQKIFKTEKVDYRIHTHDNRLIINYYHPSHHKGYKTFDELIKILSTEKAKNLIESIKNK